jgi:iron complex transport system substrate-binding protein
LWLLAAGCTRGEGGAASRAASRIASVNLAADEMLAELVPADRVVAVSRYVDNPGISNVPDHYPKSIARVTGNVETLLSLRPDLVCVNPYNSADFVGQVADAKIPVFRYENASSFGGVRAGILALGARVGAEGRAKEMVARMDRRLAELDARLANAKNRPTVYYWAGGWTAGAGSTISEMIERAGGVNLAARAGRNGMGQMPIERVLADDPDCLLLNDRQWIEGVPPLEEVPAQFQTLRAVKEGRVVRMPANLLSTLSQWVVDGTERLAALLHPECFADSQQKPVVK